MKRLRATLVATVFLAVWAAAAETVLAQDICGDVNNTGTVTTADALAVLRKSVGQNVNLQCAAGATPLETGQVTCYDFQGTQIACTDTGQDADLKLGVEHTFTDNGNGTITDNKTGLTWEKLSDDGSIHDFDDNTYSWLTAFTAKIGTLNTSSFAGHNDWRVPNLNELETIRNLGESSPSTFAVFDTACTPGCTITTCSCTSPDVYWSSTSYEIDPSNAWGVFFDDGDTYSSEKSTQNYVRAVRGGS
jgi:hypothetical protein